MKKSTYLASILVLGGAACAIAGEPCGDVVWDNVAGGSRFNHAITYDMAHNVVMQFGGTDSVLKFDDTMIWDGTTWSRLEGPGPSARDGHAMAYDAARGRVILFGGLTALGSGYIGDTWQWDSPGGGWHQLSPANAPTPRHSAAMAYDSVRQRIVLFGGNDVSGSLQGDTWEWDGSNWQLRSSTGPAPRQAHAIAFDAARGRTVLFGGDPNFGFGPYLNDTWEWDGASWTEITSTTRPTARVHHTLTYDAVRQRSVLIGGAPGIKTEGRRDVWEWDGAEWMQMADFTGQERFGHAAAFNTASGRLVLTGGGTPIPLGDTWERAGASWARRRDFAPGPNYYGAMTYDAARENIVLYSGDSRTWTWDGSVWTPRTTASNPGARSAPLAYDEARERVVLFSGEGSGTIPNDTWEWNGVTWTQVHAGGAGAPPMRSQFGVVYDAARAETLIFGGQGAGGTLRADTWTWNGSAWTVELVSGPAARIFPAMAYDAARQRVVLFGGFAHGVGHLRDTWEWDGATWSLRTMNGPAQLAYPSMAYDPVRMRVIVVGSGQTWAWDGATWTQLEAPGIPAYEHPGMAYDAARGRVTLFGGSSTFQLSPAVAPPVITDQPENTIVEGGGVATIELQATGGHPITYQWRKDRAPLANGGAISGATSPALTINPVGPKHFGVYDCIVTTPCGAALSDPVALSVLPPANPCPADFNNSGVVNSQDFFDFLTAFFTGCP